MKASHNVLYSFLIIAVLLVVGSCSDSYTGSGGGGNGQEFDSKAGPGASAEAFLRADTFTRLEVEVDYMPGHQPTPEALDSLKSFLQARLNKSEITISTPTQIPSGGQSSYSADDVRALEEQNRDASTQANSSTLQAYFIVVDGRYSDQDNVLGIAYYNTSVAFFGETIEETSSGLTAPSEEKIEGTVFRHEFGHLMGLVNNGTPMETNHQENGAHCNQDGCLMEAAVETSNFFANLFDGDIPNLDPLCVDDIQANGGK